jgi:hypothetical protein
VRAGALLLLVLASLSVACKQDRGPKSVSDQSKIPRPPPDEPPLTIQTCYAGVAHYDPSEADPQPVLLRRTAMPEHGTILEEWVEGPTASTHATTALVNIVVTDSRFTFSVDAHVNPLGAAGEHEQLAWTGEGELVGEPWKWTEWTSKQARQPPITDVITTRIAGDALEREIAFTIEDGSITQRRHDSLRELPCAEWPQRSEATLSAPTPK